jgi:8-oxo-dGTP diphosphatase
MEKTANVLLVNRAIILHKEKFLVVKRSPTDTHNPRLWEFPGGKVDRGEDIPASLSREVLEETGLIIKPVTSLVYSHSEILPAHDYYPQKLYVALFHVAHLAASARMQMSDEHTGFAWDSVDEARNRALTSESRQALEALSGAGIL